MAITRIKNSGIKTGVLKYDSVLGGYPPLMPAPTAADGGTGTTATVTFNTVTGATSYTALSTPGSFTGTGTTSPITVSGLSSGTAYTFQVRAQNAVGNGAYSAASNSVTPVTPTSFDSIATITVSGSSTTSITFSSIPSTYQHLQIRGIARTGGNTYVWMRLNADTNSNYSAHTLKATSEGVISTDANANANKMNPMVYTASTTGVWGVSLIDIHDYKSTNKNKTITAFFGADNNSANGAGVIFLASGNWRSTDAIDSVTIATDGDIFTAGTSFALYGIKG